MEQDDTAANLTAMLDTAVLAFQREWGREIKAQRQNVAGATGEVGFDTLTQILPLMGVSLSAEELTRLEEGDFTDIDVRLLLAVCMALEVGVDKSMFAALKQSAS